MTSLKLGKYTVMVNGALSHYEMVGEGEPLVLIHGLSASTWWWKYNVADLATQYRLYLVDLPGFGMMGRRHRFSLSKAAHWLDAWLEAVGLDTFSLVGHSMGGYISMMLATMRPDRIKYLVLVDSIGVPFERRAADLVPPALLAFSRTRPSFWPILAYDSLRAGPLAIWRTACEIADLDACAVAALITTPTLLIWGKQDGLVPFSLGMRLWQCIPGSRLLAIDHANHVSMFDQPQKFNAALLAFLSGEEVGILREK